MHTVLILDLLMTIPVAGSFAAGLDSSSAGFSSAGGSSLVARAIDLATAEAIALATISFAQRRTLLRPGLLADQRTTCWNLCKTELPRGILTDLSAFIMKQLQAELAGSGGSFAGMSKSALAAGGGGGEKKS